MAFRVYRDNIATTDPRSRRGAHTWTTCCRRSRATGSSGGPVPGLGLHGRQRAQPRGAGAGDPRQRAAPARRRHAGRRRGRWRLAQLPHHQREEPGDAGVPDNTLRLVDGELTDIPCYLDNGNATRAGSSTSSPTGTWTRLRPGSPMTRQRHDGRAIRVRDPELGGHRDRCQPDQERDLRARAAWRLHAGRRHDSVPEQRGQRQQHDLVCDQLGRVLGGRPRWGVSALKDLSTFNKLTDRMQQGFVNMIYLGRAMLHPDGFDTDPAFKFDPDGVGGDDPTSLSIPPRGCSGRESARGRSWGAH